MVSFRIDEDDFSRLDTFAQQTSCSRAEVLRRLLRTARLESTVDAQALTEVSRIHADLNRIGGLLKLAIRERVGDRADHYRLNLELRETVRTVSRAVELQTPFQVDAPRDITISSAQLSSPCSPSGAR